MYLCIATFKCILQGLDSGEDSEQMTLNEATARRESRGRNLEVIYGLFNLLSNPLAVEIQIFSQNKIHNSNQGHVSTNP